MNTLDAECQPDDSDKSYGDYPAIYGLESHRVFMCYVRGNLGANKLVFNVICMVGIQYRDNDNIIFQEITPIFYTVNLAVANFLSTGHISIRNILDLESGDIKYKQKHMKWLSDYNSIGFFDFVRIMLISNHFQNYIIFTEGCRQCAARAGLRVKRLLL